jgi:hypothetical protein
VTNINAIYHRNLCLFGGDVQEIKAADVNAGEQFWKGRQAVSISLQELYQWTFGYIWDCTATMSYAASSDEDTRGRKASASLTSITKIGVINHGRELKKAESSDAGTTQIIDDDSAFVTPSKYGSVKKDWYERQLYNPCVDRGQGNIIADTRNTFSAYYNSIYNIENQYLGAIGIDDDVPNSWVGAPSNASDIAMDYVAQNNQKHIYVSYKITEPLFFYLGIDPEYNNQTAATTTTYYDKKTNTVWPYPQFLFSSMATDWNGGAYGYTDPSDPVKKLRMVVDGYQIPIHIGPPDFGHTIQTFDVSIEWQKKKTRDL